MGAPYIRRMNRPRPSGKRVRVVLLTQVIGPLDYRLPDWMNADVGSVVVVPLGPRNPGRVRKRPDGKFEIVIDAADPDAFLAGLGEALKPLL